jgi:hypothetical protein
MNRRQTRIALRCEFEDFDMATRILCQRCKCWHHPEALCDAANTAQPSPFAQIVRDAARKDADAASGADRP